MSASNPPKEVDKQLDEILAEHEYKVTGMPKHWNKTPERKALDNELKAKLKQLLTQQEQAARKEGLQEYRKLILAWAKNFHPELLAELKHAGVSTAATSDDKPTQACQNAIKMAKTELLTELIGKAIELYSDGKATKHSGQVPVVPLEILERYRKELNE